VDLNSFSFNFCAFQFLSNIALQYVFPVFGLHLLRKVNPLFEGLNLTWTRRSISRFISRVSIDVTITALHSKMVLFASEDGRSPRLAPAFSFSVSLTSQSCVILRFRTPDQRRKIRTCLVTVFSYCLCRLYVAATRNCI